MGRMNNLYLVVSQELSYVAVIDPEIGGPREYYRIAELVVARNHSQARYLAWQADKDGYAWTYDFCEIPKFAVRLKEKDVEGPARIVTNEHRFTEDFGEDYEQEYDALWDVGSAPRIEVRDDV